MYNSINLMSIRKELRLSQTEFAQKLDTSQNMISKYEKQQVEIPYKILKNLYLNFKINIHSFIDGSGDMFLEDCNGVSIHNGNNSNVAINSNQIILNKSDFIDGDEVDELVQLLKEVPKSWIDKILIKLKKSLSAIDDEF